MSTFNKKIVLICIAVMTVLGAGAQQYPFQDKSLSPQERAKDLVSRMTLGEKCDVLNGDFIVRGVPRLGIPELKLIDGPCGVASWGLFGRATAFPSTLSLAASWNRDLARSLGDCLGQEWRARGFHFILSPGVNIYRASKDARNFEYMGEDPLLTSELVVPLIQGIQNRGVIATIKHFCANDQEFDRYSISTEVSERALQEIYYPPFKAGIQKAGVKSIMMGYNLVNGTWCSENPYLMKEVLRRDWGYKGHIMSDWGATHSTYESLMAGLDMECGSSLYLIESKIKPLIDQGKIKEELLDEKLYNLYVQCMEMGFFDRPQKDESIPEFNPVANEAAFKGACEGIILLKNNNILPIDKSKTIAVIGPNASPVFTTDRINRNVLGISYGGGGSSKVNPWYLTTDLQGIMQEFGASRVLYAEGISNKFVYDSFSTSLFYTAKGGRGFNAKYFALDENGNKKTETPLFSNVTRNVNFEWMDQKPYNKKELGEDFQAEWESTFTPDRTDSIYVFVNAQGAYKLWIDGKLLIDESKSVSFANRRVTVFGEKGKRRSVRLEYQNQRSNPAEIKLGYRYASDIDYSEALKIAKKADVVVFCGGIDGSIEMEGKDRPFELPFGQDALIKQLAKVNPNIVVAVHGGGAMGMTQWLDDVKGLVHLIYPGMEGGKAFGQILSGKVNPSAKLPFTIEKRWEDSPAYGNYDETRKEKKIYYREGIFTGYRGYEHKGVQPLFPFGHGLSYTTFEYANLSVSVADRKQGIVKVALDVKNTGKYYGGEVVQLYVNDPVSKEERPVKELKDFNKVWLQPGEVKRVEFTLDKNAFQYFNSKARKWVLEKGQFNILVGASSQDIRLKQEIKL